MKSKKQLYVTLYYSRFTVIPIVVTVYEPN